MACCSSDPALSCASDLPPLYAARPGGGDQALPHPQPHSYPLQPQPYPLPVQDGNRKRLAQPPLCRASEFCRASEWTKKPRNRPLPAIRSPPRSSKSCPSTPLLLLPQFSSLMTLTFGSFGQEHSDDPRVDSQCIECYWSIKLAEKVALDLLFLPVQTASKIVVRSLGTGHRHLQLSLYVLLLEQRRKTTSKR